MLKKISLSGIRFNRQEWSGALGDIGTDLPLLIGMILAAHLHIPSVLILFGLMQILTGLYYRIPMPVQPLKAMAALVIAQQISSNVLYGGGLAIGLSMLLLTATRLIEWLHRVIPKAVVRGIQFGLGLKLSLIALENYLPKEGIPGFILAGVCLLIILFLLPQRRFPPAFPVIIAGILYAIWIRKVSLDGSVFSFEWPKLTIPQLSDILTGFMVLALPQLPLSLGNSILATRQITADLFPDKKISVSKISLSYSIMNILNPFLNGIPVCHGAGGMAGHYAFGGRTGGSVILYGILFCFLGLCFSRQFSTIIQFFPFPVLAVILLCEGLALLVLIKDLRDDIGAFTLAILIGLLAAILPYGFLIALILGTGLDYLLKSKRLGLPGMF